jgi:gluconolactonase
MKLKTVVESGDPELLATGFQFTEGPVWHPDGYLLFSDIPANRIHRWTPDGQVDVWREPSGNSNGLTLDRENRLVACEHGNRRVSCAGADGSVNSLADRYEGRRLSSPNDLVVKSDGTVYFTDPPYGITPSESSSYSEEQEQPCNGLYRILGDGSVELLVDDFDRPNGLAFSPGESILYVDDSPRRHVRAFDVRADGSLTNSRIFADMDHPQPGSPDGMKINAEGTLFVAGATGIWVFEPDGACLGVLVTPERPANCAWGDDDRRSLYITARPSLYRIRVSVPGAGGAAVA